MALENEKNFLAEESFFEGHYDRDLWRTLAKFWNRFRLRLTVTFLAGLFSRFCVLAISLVIGSWADSLCSNLSACQGSILPIHYESSWDYLRLIMWLMILGFIGSGVFLIIVASTGARVNQLIHNETLLRVSRLPMQLLDRTPVGHIYTRFSSDFNHLLLGNGPHLAQISMIIIDIILMLSIITWIDYRFAFLCVPFILISAWIYRRNSSMIRDLRRGAASARSPSISHFSSTIKGFLSIDLFGKRPDFVKRFRSLVDDYYRQKSAADFAFYFFGLKISMATALLMLLLSFLSIYLIQQGELSIGATGIVISYVAIIASFIQRLFTLITSLEQGLTGIERIHEYMKKETEEFSLLPQESLLTPASRKEDPTPTPYRLNQPTLAIQSLSFRYGPTLPWILKDFTMELKAGETLGIIGRTGSGKSSLFQVLLHMYPHEEGQIYLGGHILNTHNSSAQRTLSLNDWRQHFSLISQEPHIFNASVRENLDPEGRHTDTVLYEILLKVGLHEWITRLPAQLDTNLSEDGLEMSTGQRQQLATARSLLRDSPIVLMDEATSAVDPKSEEFFMRATKELLQGKTRLIIAHRLSTVMDCDRVLWIKDGRVHRLGAAEDVIAEFIRVDETQAASPSLEERSPL